MRFFDEEWEWLGRASCMSIFFNWNVTDRAAVYNNELFEEVYRRYAEELEGFMQEANEQKAFINRMYQDNLKEMEEVLPAQIKEKVADLRILALGTVTQQTMDEIKLFSDQARMQLKVVHQKYQGLYEFALDHMDKITRDGMNRSFHDSRIISCGYEGMNLFMKLKMDGGYDCMEDQYLKLIMKDASILKGEVSNELEVWINHELYYEDQHYLLYVSFSGGSVVIQASDITCEFLHSFLACDYPLTQRLRDEIKYGTFKELIASGQVTREEAMKHPLYENLGEEAFENINILISGDMDSLGKLTVHKMMDDNELRLLSGKKYCYKIMFFNDWGCNPIKMTSFWLRKGELLQYIKDNCRREIELWTVWSDSFSDVETKEYRLEDLAEADLEEIYANTAEGVAKSRRVRINN